MSEPKEEVLNYVRSRMVQGPVLMKRMSTGSVTGGKVVHRHYFKEVMELVDDHVMNGKEHMLILTGIRGAGKSTLLSQVYQELRSRGFRADRMIYVSMDEVKIILGAGIKDIFEAVKEIVPEDFLSVEKRDVVLFLDEVQYDEEWSLALKVIYDSAPDLLVLCTGSSALHLREQGDLARRGRFLELPPLSLPEFIELSDRGSYDTTTSQDMTRALFDSKDPVECFERLRTIAPPGGGSDMGRGDIVKFITQGSLPIFLAENDPDELRKKYTQLLEKVVFIDMPGMYSFDRETAIKISQVVYLLADSDRISYSKISSTVGLSKGTISQAIRGLELAGILTALRARGGEYAKARSAPRYKFKAPAMRCGMLERIGKDVTTPETYGILFEDAVISWLDHLLRNRRILDMWYESSQGGVDLFVRSRDGKEIGIELGWGRKDTDQIRKGRNDHSCKYYLIASTTGMQRRDDVIFIPREYLLLTGA